uniref:EF-hand domain-containing protein n=1 Tax=Pseudo-nitzschia australis TaxID=44445 RepID=A0A7S4EEU9_9STRA|mmetsp:Transcript_25720/g.56406  ORF Transcript_25720/g.56406 Transcript_25720/m.56406 type:complete len:775 (-) Transcript_25720:210-2534(-)|eukprot:CAMPEP_0168178014 /NCGR_PEP_ID=MMETSP0139_2-20121125/8834_1 /TAXON_ID=44445 /ORGANISM="Pseudo-nitzschia australis, Strain 10249 10 AB" /LENGTH=774 /DNA_ID=CAMNT_0008097249 /DNA_START=382 /DNA_END=2706 /DNA_ORIENTATION=+
MPETKSDTDLEFGSGGQKINNCCFRTRHEPLVIETPIGVTLRGKGQLRAAVQTVAFGALVMGYGVLHVYSTIYTEEGDYDSDEEFLRFLQTGDINATDLDQSLAGESAVSCEDSINKADSWWMTLIYVIGILYMFLALAIICDEFFVPALEELSGPRRLNMSMDVAGATLMAAGGSAPELATSLIGTFRQSEIGFGTIVGSAVFNILFVIGMCSILAKDVLSLTWWPLFRDSAFYTVGLIVLAVFSGFNSKNEIHLWESGVLFAMYLLYCLIMWQNKNIYKALTGKVLFHPDGESEECEPDARTATNGEPNGSGGGGNDDNNKKDNEEVDGKEETTTTDKRSTLQNQFSASSVSVKSSNASRASQVSLGLGSEKSSASQPHFLWQGTFRAGILKLLKDGDSWADTAGAGMVSKIMGDADYVFEQVDKDGNGNIDREELRQLFDLLECHATNDELTEVFTQLDANQNGVISRNEFTDWYLKSEKRLLAQVRNVFDQIDINKSNTLERNELKTLLATLDPHVTDADVQSALTDIHKAGSTEELTFEEFSEWYKSSVIYQRKIHQIDENMGGVCDNLYPPAKGGIRDWIWYIICLPLVFLLTFTVPDVQKPGFGKWCYATFLLSIAWIGGFSYFMVDWAEIVGNTIGIPDELMGLTVLAAGTSVPDLLSSVIVARRGQGDMAVSSSVGSNIFDILVGLPIPWILYSAVNKGRPVEIGSDGLVMSLLILVGMIVLVIGSIHCQGWKLTKVLGGMMFLLYIGFLVQAIVLAMPLSPCSE